MRVAIGADHAGLELKNRLRDLLRGLGHEVSDLGTHTAHSTDYPDHAVAVARLVATGEAERGVLVCGTGLGMAIAANKVAGVRAAACNSLYLARMAREHNDANVLALGARDVAAEQAEEILLGFLDAAFAGGRHQRRIDKINGLDS